MNWLKTLPWQPLAYTEGSWVRIPLLLLIAALLLLIAAFEHLTGVQLRPICGGVSQAFIRWRPNHPQGIKPIVSVLTTSQHRMNVILLLDSSVGRAKGYKYEIS